MTEREWLAATDPTPMLAVLACKRKLRLFGCAACRRVPVLTLDNACHAAIEASEHYADGLITAERLDLLSVAAEEAWKDTVLEPRGEGDFAALAASYVSSPSLNVPVEAVAAAAQASQAGTERERAAQADLLRDIFGNPFRPVIVDPAWLTSDVLALATGIYDDRAFDHMPILADALQDAGCDCEEILNHCREANGVHVRGCWVVDMILDKT